MKKRVSLKVWMIIKIIPALLLVLFYWMLVNKKYNPIHTYLQYAILACMFISLYIVEKNRDVVDEYTKEILSKTNTVCLKLSYAIFGILLFPCALNTNSMVIGYGIVISLCILTVLRSIIFCVLDSRGM
ncbi:hypothetical protein [Clostridium frigidicarnis]|uniref:Uncharacterized protein n=1 Tax=Clostridium frigidicarnis TaxID=84698 RepID=A0A1I1B207_9CLOT|nr:hypothetical protein [Clostridium frigidicarnis]SFB44375.1 hypothetical protein SAMN04488528_105813 [Clostridium frigidicarnis]